MSNRGMQCWVFANGLLGQYMYLFMFYDTFEVAEKDSHTRPEVQLAINGMYVYPGKTQSNRHVAGNCHCNLFRNYLGI